MGSGVERAVPGHDYRPFHLPGCPARDPAVNVDTLRIAADGTVETVRVCTCPAERFGPGSMPVGEPGRSDAVNAARIRLRSTIEDAIEAWRDSTDNDGTLRLYDPNEVKELARAIRNHLERRQQHTREERK